MTKVNVGVNVAVYPVTYVSNEVLNCLFRIIDKRGLSLSYLIDHKEALVDGLLTWISTRYLKKLIVEIYASDEVVERWDMCFEYSTIIPSSSESTFETNLRKLEEFLNGLPSLDSDLEYRVIAVLKDGAPEVPGWGPTKLRPIDHLRNKNIGGIIKADYIGVAFQYWGR